MFGHTDAFKEYRKLSQSHIDFVVLVCHAVPALQADVALLKDQLTYPPDHFKQTRNSKAFVAGLIDSYKDSLARTTLITVFSYFEAYVKDALTEIIKFHGGDSGIKVLAKERATKFIGNIPPTLKLHKRKLQDRRNPAKLAKYQKYNKILDDKRFKFPTDLFANFGIVQLLPKLDPKKGMQAWEIPSLLQECLLFPLLDLERETFEEIRTLRNRVAHGRAPTIRFEDSQRYASLLHTFAARIDRHIVEHFFLIQTV